MGVAALEPLDSRLAARLAGRLAGHVQAADLPRPAQVASWMDLVDLCRELDDGVVAAEADDVLALHETVLSLAIGCGTWLIQQIETNRADISPSGRTLETLKASLELLRILHRSRHSQFTGEEIEAAQRRIFSAPA